MSWPSNWTLYYNFSLNLNIIIIIIIIIIITHIIELFILPPLFVGMFLFVFFFARDFSW
jgi:hypothetical protein